MPRVSHMYSFPHLTSFPPTSFWFKTLVDRASSLIGLADGPNDYLNVDNPTLTGRAQDLPCNSFAVPCSRHASKRPLEQLVGFSPGPTPSPSPLSPNLGPSDLSGLAAFRGETQDERRNAQEEASKVQRYASPSTAGSTAGSCSYLSAFLWIFIGMLMIMTYRLCVQPPQVSPFGMICRMISWRSSGLTLRTTFCCELYKLRVPSSS